MKLILGAFLIAVLIGAFSGPEVQETGSVVDLSYASQHIGILILLTAAAMFLVIVFQVLRRNSKFGRWAIGFMACVSAFFLSAGLEAFVYAGTATSISLMYLAVGTGGVLGVLCAWGVFLRRHLKKPRKSDA